MNDQLRSSLERLADTDAEQFILGSIFQSSADNPETFHHIQGILAPEYFYTERNRIMFDTMRIVFARELLQDSGRETQA